MGTCTTLASEVKNVNTNVHTFFINLTNKGSRPGYVASYEVIFLRFRLKKCKLVISKVGFPLISTLIALLYVNIQHENEIYFHTSSYH